MKTSETNYAILLESRKGFLLEIKAKKHNFE
jgi:hypothetical protein